MPLLVEEAVVYVRPFYVRREPLASSADTVTEPLVQFVAVVQEQSLGFGPSYESALAELYNISREEAASLLGTGAPIDIGDADPEEDFSGRIDIDELPEELIARLNDALEQFDEAEESLPDFAEFERLQNEAIDDLQDLLSEVEALDSSGEPAAEADAEADPEDSDTA